MPEVEFCKGHGTENDFVLLPDPDARLELTPQRVRALCDRRRGLGADGVLRVVRTGKLAADGESAVPPVSDVDDQTWFMDYRNADGSVAEMCGNGVRVFARYLVESGLAPAGSFDVATRGGLRPVVVHPDLTVTVDMGPVRVLGASRAVLGDEVFEGLAVDVGNPHLVCPVAAEVARLDLTVPPGHDAAVFPHGVNVEFVNVTGDGLLRMRVHERGVGETRSCGTGTVAAAAATLHAAGRTTGEYTVRIPGGEVRVLLDARTATLTGPAVLVAAGRLSADWWAAAGHTRV